MAVASLAMVSCQSGSNQSIDRTIYTEIPERPAGQTDVVGLTVPAIDTVKVGVIGIGSRGPGSVDRLANIPGALVVAVCDIYPERTEYASRLVTRQGHPAPTEYNGDKEVWKQICEREDIDLVYITTDWASHVPMAIYAMEHGKNAVVEVPATTSLEECWAMVDASERTRKHCMLLENCCYDFFELATLNMAQQGLLGEIVHVEGAYIHDLRAGFFGREDNVDEEKDYVRNWRLEHNAIHDGNPYPTHGLGPIAQALDINRGDKMDVLVSLSSNQVGLTEYAKNKYGEDSPEAQREYKLGDMNNTLIKTHNGKSILVQHDVTSPRPYNRKHCLSGTKGYIEKYPNEYIALEPNAHSFLSEEEFDAVMAEYEHPLSKEIGEVARKIGGHGGMDYIMDYRLIYCLNNGLPLDINVYDSALWSAIAPLSELSVENGSAPVAIPDFTRGAWDKEKGFKHAMK